jgi:hypothetical protein
MQPDMVGARRFLKILAAEEFPARRGLGHRILARIAHLCHVRFYAGSYSASARHNTGTQFRNIALAHLSGHRHREQAVLAGRRQLAQMRFYAGLDPAFAGLDVGAEFLDVAGAGQVRLLCHGGGTRQQQRCQYDNPRSYCGHFGFPRVIQKKRIARHIRKPAAAPERRPVATSCGGLRKHSAQR